MNNHIPSRKEIMQMIETKQISSEEGLALLKQLMRGSDTRTAPLVDVSVLTFYRAEWIQNDRFGNKVAETPSEVVLVLDRRKEVFAALQKRGCRAVLVQPGTSFRQVGADVFEINPAVADDYRQLAQKLKAQDLLPGRIFHLWSHGHFTAEQAGLQQQLDNSVYSVFYTTQALMEQKIKRTALLYVYRGEAGELQPQFEAVSGTAKSIRKENPNFAVKTIGLEMVTPLERLVEILLHESATEAVEDVEVRYEQGQRLSKRLGTAEVPNALPHALPIQEQGTYLITGGVGGLGLLFANYFARKCKAKLVLTGRSPLDARKQQQIRDLETLGAQVLYVQADVAKQSDVERLVATAKASFGALNGILHSAGVLRDSFVLKKTAAEMADVLAPKVFGTVHLDKATEAEPLDFFVLFSSLAAEIGNVGQSDYAYANAFMDRYAALRTQRKPQSKTLAINWPLWLEGGMGVTEEAIETMKRTNGIVPLSTANGMIALEDGLASSFSQLLVLEEVKQFEDKTVVEMVETAVETHAPVAVAVDVQSEEVDANQLRAKTERYLKEVLSKEIRLPVNRIDSHEALENYGLDSVMVLSLIKAFENQFGDLSKTLLFEYQNIADLAEYFMESHRDKLLTVTGLASAAKPKAAVPQPTRTTPTVQAAPVAAAPVTPTTHTMVTAPQSIAPVAPAVEAPAPAAAVELDDTQLLVKTERYLKEVLSKEIKLPVNKIDSNEALENYGLDSVMVMALIKAYEGTFGELSKTLLFEYQNIADLAGYFVENHRSKLLATEAIVPKAVTPKATAPTAAVQPKLAQRTQPQAIMPTTPANPRFLDTPASAPVQTPVHTPASVTREEVAVSHAPQPVTVARTESVQTHHVSSDKDDIAIIGVSGRYPLAANLDEFWENLKAGRDCVTEIPEDRWDYREYYDPDKKARGKANSKWGGFIDDVDKFDPLFFNIAPIEAKLIDPQERLFLESVWHTIEDAGYSRQKLSKRNVGVFVGIMYGHYQLFGAEESMKGNVFAAGSSYASIPNRVSYVFNFHGPSIALDTMCSSSLTAIHLACDSIHKGESEMAIAGGVNLTLHPNKYILLSQSNFMASDGRCRTFGADGDGYVPGEGVGTVLLKPLKKAIADGDQIYAVIKSTSINHGGKTNGYFVPNPNAQHSVIADALRQAEIDPRTISYIEAHGTGTSLGDPIEITGLSKAFREYTRDKQFCSIGSAKSNLGHLESSAGIAGITKLLLQMKHKQLVPSIHSSTLNPNINFAESPFYVQQELTEWKKPVIVENGVATTYPRRAGISAFGAGGANSHIILEEYEAPETTPTVAEEQPQVVVLSAKNQERLREMATNLLAFLTQKAGVKAATPATTTTRVQPQDLQAELLGALADVLQISTTQIDPASDLADCGIDLLGLQTLAERINETYSLNLTALELSNYTSLDDLVAYVKTTCEDALDADIRTVPVTSESPLATETVKLHDIAYTLQVGREGMDERLALVVADAQELYDTLTAFVAGKTDLENVHRGNVRAGRDKANLFVSGRAGEEFIKIVMQERDLEKLAQLWVSGIEIDWTALHDTQTVRRISLPVYPFARERHWVPITDGPLLTVAQTATPATSTVSKLHPLVDSNISDLKGQKYKTLPDLNAFYATDASVWGQPLFPNAAAIEMVLAVGQMAASDKVRTIRDLVFAAPVTLDAEQSEMHVGLHLAGDDVDFEWSVLGANGAKTVAAQGRLTFAKTEGTEQAEVFDLAAIPSRSTTHLQSAECYARLQQSGMQYANGYAVLRDLHLSGNEALAYLELPNSLRASAQEYGLHPVLLEGALQAAVLFAQATGQAGDKPLLLAEVAEVTIAHFPQTACYVHLAQNQEALTIRLLDDQGLVLVTLTDAVLAPVEMADGAEQLASVLLEKSWRESTATATGTKLAGRVIVLAHAGNVDVASQLFANQPDVTPIFVTNQAGQAGQSNTDYMFDFTNAEQGTQIIQTIRQTHGAIAGLIDLSDLHAKPIHHVQSALGKIALFQGLIKNVQIDAFPLLHFTRGLQTLGDTEATLAGADVAGLIKMLGAEYRKVLATTVDVDTATGDLHALREIITSELAMQAAQNEVMYRNGRRYVAFLQETTPANNAFTLPHPDRVTVITGGTRGIGAEMAKHLVGKGAQKLVLMGVQPCPPREQWATVLQDAHANAGTVERIKLVQSLEAQGAQVELYSGSLLDKANLQTYFAEIRAKWGAIGGVLHCAGLASMENPAFISKNSADMARVFEPKIGGLQTLHEIFSADALDFFVLFSSVSAVTPPLATGVSDYATANAFMDLFANFRIAQGDTYYKSINWTNWSGVGMGEMTSAAYNQLGLTAHPVAPGLQLFDAVMSLSASNVLPCIVRPAEFDPALLLKTRLEPKVSIVQPSVNAQPKPIAKPAPQSVATSTAVTAGLNMMTQLKDLFSSELTIPVAQLDEETPFGDFGVDSILLAELVQKIEGMIGKKLDPSTLLEHPTLRELAAHLNEEYYGGALQETAATEEPAGQPEQSQQPTVHPVNGQRLVFAAGYQKQLQPYVQRDIRSQAVPAFSAPQGTPKIAVIGMACHFPGANSKDAYWNNLSSGISSVVEVPKSRFDIDKIYATEYAPGKSISRWGGFIDGIEDFDPDYFQISADDAPAFDPLIRQFMEVTVDTIHDSGYENKELWGKKVGVFVGSRVGNFASRIKKAVKNSIVGIGQNFISAHMSHFLNLKGPSVVVDTACSSSLVSIHLACQSLMTGESEMAIAGGVDILLDENPYIVLSEGRALSPTGQCRTFDQHADGFVPGEGCGAVMLKLLDKAIEDGDHIYAVIDATAVNNDGRTMGITTPNLEAQAEVIREAQQKAGISPASISYVETHGTGTMIGDPIELKALTKVFRQATDETGFCGVGSVKSNFGHLLSAAGVASFIKVALSIHHKQLPPTLNCDTPNPRFKFDSSPFYPNTSLQQWEPRDGARRAAISSFGFGGTNAHVILNECDPNLLRRAPRKRKPLPPVAFNRKRYWIEAEETIEAQAVQTVPVAQRPKLMELIDETPAFVDRAAKQSPLPKLMELVDETP